MIFLVIGITDRTFSRVRFKSITRDKISIPATLSTGITIKGMVNNE